MSDNKSTKIKQGSQGGSAASLYWLAKADCVSLLISDITLIVEIIHGRECAL